VSSEISGTKITENNVVDAFNSVAVKLHMPYWAMTDRNQTHAIRKNLSFWEPDFIKDNSGILTPHQAARIFMELATAKEFQPKYQVGVSDFDPRPEKTPRPKKFDTSGLQEYQTAATAKRMELQRALETSKIQDIIGALNSAVNILTKGDKQ
jgi:hypothetical protein